jgi:hypothetical protein
MTCKDCKKEIQGNLKYLAYYLNGKPVRHQLCDACMKKKWLEYKATIKD